jgi:hypothetical protein
MDREILTVDEVASRLKVKPSWIYTHAGQLGACKVGKYLRFSWPRVLERLDKMLVSHSNDPVYAPPNKRPEKHREQSGDRFLQRID